MADYVETEMFLASSEHDWTKHRLYVTAKVYATADNVFVIQEIRYDNGRIVRNTWQSDKHSQALLQIIDRMYVATARHHALVLMAGETIEINARQWSAPTNNQ